MLLLFFGLPMLVVLVVSFFDYSRTEIIPAFIFDNYLELLPLRGDAPALCQLAQVRADRLGDDLVLGFNIAYFLVFHVRSLLFADRPVPAVHGAVLTSNIIRMISWIPFLGRNGIFNQVLQGAGVTSQPLEFLLFSDFAVVVAYVHLFTLFMVVPIFNSMARIDQSLLEAARDAGAGRFRVVAEVVLPLSQDRHRAGLDLRRHPGDGRFLRRAHHERRPERLGRLGAAERGRGDAVSAGGGQRGHHGDHRHPDGGGHPARRRRAQGTGVR